MDRTVRERPPVAVTVTDTVAVAAVPGPKREPGDERLTAVSQAVGGLRANRDRIGVAVRFEYVSLPTVELLGGTILEYQPHVGIAVIVASNDPFVRLSLEMRFEQGDDCWRVRLGHTDHDRSVEPDGSRSRIDPARSRNDV